MSALYWAPVGTVTEPPGAVGILTNVTDDPTPAPTLEPVTLTLRADLTPLQEAFRRLGDQIVAMRPWLDLLAEFLTPERPVDRARRLHVQRAMRARARRAARKGRVLR